MAKDLTIVTLQSVKPGVARKELPDGKVRGLFFIIQKSGARSWALRYRFNGVPRKYTIGSYPGIDLKAARDAAGLALVKIANGEDPAAMKRDKRAAARIPKDRDLIENVIERFIERYAKPNAPRSWQETERILKREVAGPVRKPGEKAPPWTGRALSDITRRDVHDLLDGVIDRGSAIMANRVLAAIRRMFAWCAERDMITISPCVGVKAPSAERSRDRVLSDVEIARVWRACDLIGWPFAPLIRLLILTGQRREEVAAIRWVEIDLEKKTWVLPKERAKNRLEHEIPLSPMAVEILTALPRIEGKNGFVFTTGGEQPVTGFSKAKGRLDAFMSDGKTESTLPDWVIHDLRRTVASGMARLGVNLPVIEKVLNHVSGSFGGIVGVYQRHSFADEKRAALDLWGRHVEAVVTGKAGGNVVALKAVRT